MRSKTEKTKPRPIETSRAVRALARQNTAHAMKRLVELTDSPNHCVAVAAVMAVLERSEGKVPVTYKSAPGSRRAKGGKLEVKISQLKHGSGGDAR